MSWFTCVCDSDYEIFDEFPYRIRRKSNKRIVNEYLEKSTGYVALYLNRKFYRKHRILALQFIPNPDPERFTVVDHIDHDRLNNRISNIRWTSQRFNNNNTSKQNFVDDLPDDSIVVEKYIVHEFDGLYFSPGTNRFYVFNGINYNVKPIFQNKLGYYFTCVYDVTGKHRTISYIKFKKEQGLI